MMVDLTFSLMDFSRDFIVVLIIFLAMVFIGRYLLKSFKNISFFRSSRFFNIDEYLPEEEQSTLKQVYNLIMVLILIINILYLIFGWSSESFNLLIFDLIVSLLLAINLDISSFKSKCILFLLIPFGSISELLVPFSWVMFFNFVHIFVFLYFIKKYYENFFRYTEENRLGITILLLFSIVFISFFITIVVEDVPPIDSIAMVSNAFTSNGYSILGTSGIGKLNAIFLVWAGFILSGVATATLTVAIVVKQVNRKFDHLEELVEKNKKR